MNTFEDIEHIPLRTYNRCVLAHNILEDSGKAKLEDYLNQFSKKEREEMMIMYSLLKEHGPKRLREMVTYGLTFSDEDYEGEEIEGMKEVPTLMEVVRRKKWNYNERAR